MGMKVRQIFEFVCNPPTFLAQGAGSALLERSRRFEEIVRGMKYVSRCSCIFVVNCMDVFLWI